MSAKREKVKRVPLDKSAMKRLMQYILRYKGRVVLVLICIILSSAASVASSLFIETLIDDYISPLLLEASPVFTGLLKALAMMACIYMCGVAASLIYTRTMAVIAQGTLKDIRDDMFKHMQTLPIKYFDTHTHGDVMSRYTNDTDSLRQMIAQSMPQMFDSLVTIVMVFLAMLLTSILMTRVTEQIAGKSSHYFIRQQRSLGDVNGYIEEMINGQKVVKVFCHEEAAKEVFDRKNEELRDCSATANGFSNILMPIMGNMGYLMYVLIAIVGGALAIWQVGNLTLTGVDVLTLGAIGSFLQLSRSFMRPISQVSQQLNSVAMALAGAGRIFELMDEPSESDDGYVTLVNAKRTRDGQLIESSHRTGLWAWRHPHQADGTVTSICIMLTLPMKKAKTFCTTLPFTQSLAKRSPSSAQPAQAKLRSPT